MTLSQLRYIISVAENRNFTLAADKLNVTQPTLSMQIKKFEEDLNIEIFDRKTNPITITKIGQKVIDQAKFVLREAKNLQNIVEEEKNTMAGEFTVGIIPTILPNLAPLFLKTFEKKYPKIRLRIIEMRTADILLKLKNDLLDFGILVTPLNEPDIIEKKLYYEPFVAFVKENHRLYSKEVLNPDDLKLVDMIIMEEGHCFRNNVLSICSDIKTQQRNLEIESGSFTTLLKLVKEGYGMTLLPSLYSEDLSDADKKYLKQFSTPEPTREVSLVYHKSQIRVSFINEFSKLIQGILRGKIYFESDNISSPTISIPK